MIPVELRVDGLHSYRDPVTVPFDELVEDGFFGIFGPTGSGKSTLLDAMTLALYGQVDRLGGRDKEPMFHLDRDEVEVSYTFDLGGTRYEARRRLVRRDGGATTREAELRHLPKDAVLASGAREVDEEVQDLLGMDFDQFTRAVFLPQGKFAEFLQDTPADRLELLGEIFGLDRYGDRLRRRARARRDELKERVDELRGELEGLEDVTPEGVQALREQLESVQRCVRVLEDRQEALEDDVQDARSLRTALEDLEEARDELEELEARQEAVEGKREVLEAAEAAADPHETLEGLREVRDDLEDLRAQVGALEDREEDLEDRLEEAVERREDREEELEARRDELLEARTHLRTVERRADEWDEHAEKREALAEELASLEEEDLREPPEDLDGAPEALGDVVDEGEAAREARLEAQDALEETRGHLEDRREQVAEVDEALEAARERVREREDEVEELQETVEAVRRSHRAGLLSRDLEAGEPCPVCGSEHHPDPAEAPETDVEARREDLQEARERAEDARGQVRELEARREETAQRVDELEAEVEEARDDLEAAREREEELREDLPAALADLDWEEASRRVRAWEAHEEAADLRERIETHASVLQDIRGAWAEVQEALDLEDGDPTPETRERASGTLEARLEAVDEKREALREAVEDAREDLQEVRGDLEAARARRGTLAEREEDLEEDLREELAETPFEGVEEVEEAHRPPGRVAELREEVEAFDEALGAARREEERLEEAVAELDLTPDEAGEVLAEAEAVDDLLGTAREEAGKVGAAYRREQRDLERKRELEEEMEGVDADHAVAQRLTRLLGGRGFVEFLARDQFRVVLDRASQRLGEISGGRFHLRGGPREIRIVDYLEDGEERDHRTLSGGETFMVSLSLALALSDAIQHNRGGAYPPVEFFFLDEGFGSLDEATLGSVMGMLRELVDQDVRVGLITHVTDVEQHVPRRLMVEPPEEGRGSRVRLER